MAKAKNDREPLKVENTLDLLLTLLYSPGASSRAAEPIAGITRLQKLVFLLKQGGGPEAMLKAAKGCEYQPYKMGPFSRKLSEDVSVLESLGYVKTRALEYLITDDTDRPADDQEEVRRSRTVESTQFELSEEGLKIGKELYESLPRRDREALDKFKAFFNRIPLRQLLIFVYTKYPQFATESTIRGQLGL